MVDSNGSIGIRKTGDIKKREFPKECACFIAEGEFKIENLFVISKLGEIYTSSRTNKGEDIRHLVDTRYDIL